MMKDLQSNLFGRDTSDFGYSLLAAPGTSDGLSPATEAPLAGVWPMQQPINTTRRNSTSSVSSISSARNRMSLNPLTSLANAIPETTTATLSAAISSISTIEEKFRGRAYSDGASSLSVEFNSQIQQQPIGSSRYKTELCRPFKENGKCKYGDKCQFAHGKQELRHLIRHPKYKTELCRTFHTSGICPYGPRCHFIHNQDDVHQSNFSPQTPPARGDRSQVTASLITQGSPMPVPTPHISERNHYNRRPAQLNLLSRQLSTGSLYGNVPYQPRNLVSGSPPYYQQDMTCSSLMSPTSPTSGSAGTMFNYPTNPAVALANMMSAQPQFDETFDMLLSQGQSQYESTVNEDSAFDGPMTPPDSDRESMTGSPPEKQRLPIFRCLSQS